MSILAALAPVMYAQPRGMEPVVPTPVPNKLALVIGNSRYAKAPLKNPGNDALAMEATLRRIGFEVTLLQNGNLKQMREVIDDFAARQTSGSFAFFYFSGHGIQVRGSNYLLPVDFNAASEVDVEYEAYDARRVQEKMEASGARLRVLVLDACRNNPFGFNRASTRGLAPMSVNAEGTLIAFSTGDNNVADDNQAGENGLYTKHLLPALTSPGLHLYEIFERVKDEVYIASRRAQNPSIYLNIVGRYYLVSSPPPAPVLSGSVMTASVQPSVPARPTGSTQSNPKDGLIYVWINPGRFMMGCASFDRECFNEEKPVHEVEISRGFWIGQTEVTQVAFERITGQNPSRFKGPRLPVEQVNWQEAQSYCRSVGLRLPTEAEWEYAARAGDSAGRYAAISQIAWYKENSGGHTHEVALKQPNSWGLYDMLGNAYEWTADWFGPYVTAKQRDPQGPSSGKSLAVRGGFWDTRARGIRVSVRGEASPGERGFGFGLRCAGELY